MPTCSITRIKGSILEQVLRAIRPSEAYFWATHNGAEIDLFFQHRGRRYAVEVKFSEAPTITRSMRIALEDLALDHLWIVYPGPQTYPVHDKITVWSFQKLADLPSQIQVPRWEARRRGEGRRKPSNAGHRAAFGRSPHLHDPEYDKYIEYMDFVALMRLKARSRVSGSPTS